MPLPSFPLHQHADSLSRSRPRNQPQQRKSWAALICTAPRTLEQRISRLIRASRLAAANQSRNNARARAAALIPICCSRHEIWPNFRLDLILFSLIGAPLTHVLINFYLLISSVPPLKLHLPGIITRARARALKVHLCKLCLGRITKRGAGDVFYLVGRPTRQPATRNPLKLR